jgi:hypothetical protein
MQSPTTPSEDDLAFIPTEHAVQTNGPPQLSAGNRKAAKRTLPWELKDDEIQLALPRPQDEDDYIRETKRPRLEDPIPTSADEAPTENTPHDTTVALPPPPPAATESADSDPVTDTNPIVRRTGAPRNNWTPAEDAQLTRAFMNTPKKKHKGEFTSDWVAISAQITDRTSKQCINRWRRTLDPSIDRMNGRTGSWTEDEDIKLKNAVHEHGSKDWAAIAALLPGRIMIQCYHRWHRILDTRVDQTLGRSGKWNEDEDINLKNAVHKHGGKQWAKIAALVPGRTRIQCQNRWYEVLDPGRIKPANRRTGKWTSAEDIQLKIAVHKHDGKDWAAIAAHVPDRTMNQCRCRWRSTLAGRMHVSK